MKQPLSSLFDFKEDNIKNLHQIEASSISDTQVHLSTTMRVFEEATGSKSHTAVHSAKAARFANMSQLMISSVLKKKSSRTLSTQ